jgi:4,5-DOPA dioxygenase extradiol
MPAIFFGHDNPMNAIGRNSYTDSWNRIGQQTPRPRAILSISAHWPLHEGRIQDISGGESDVDG